MKKLPVQVFGTVLLSGILSLGIPTDTFRTISEGQFFGFVEVFAEESWEREMKEVCYQSDSENAANFSEDKLKSLLVRCDKLKTQIEPLDESARKFYGKRLQMCRDYYKFILDGKNEEREKENMKEKDKTRSR
jgi:hypothetical protein